MRVLLVSGTLKGRDFFAHLVQEYGPPEVLCAQDGKEARETLSKMEIDILIIHAPLPDEFGEALAEYASRNSYCGMVLPCRSKRQADSLRGLLFRRRRSGRRSGLRRRRGTECMVYAMKTDAFPAD